MLGSIWVPSKSHQQGQVSFERGMVFLLLITSEFDNRNKTGANTKIFHIFLLALLTLFKTDGTLLLPSSCSSINKFGGIHIWRKTETKLSWIQLYYPVQTTNSPIYDFLFWPSFLLFAGARREHSIVSPLIFFNEIFIYVLCSAKFLYWNQPTFSKSWRSLSQEHSTASLKNHNT